MLKSCLDKDTTTPPRLCERMGAELKEVRAYRQALVDGFWRSNVAILLVLFHNLVTDSVHKYYNAPRRRFFCASEVPGANVCWDNVSALPLLPGMGHSRLIDCPMLSRCQ